jgi:pyrroline-5-carboxylate reductase
VSGPKRILLLGFGNMGQALVNGWLARGRAPETISVVDPSDAARDAASRMGLDALPDCRAAAGAGADVVVLAVKPAQAAGVLADCRERFGPDSVLLSIAAGRTLSQLAAPLGRGQAVVRAMPNTPAAIGRGMTVLCANRHVGTAQRAACEGLMSAVGAVEWVDDERSMDAVTAVSGSGPAYLFLLIECLTEAALEAGLDARLAETLATQTIAGAAAYAEQSGVGANELRRRVTSPNGTTEAALKVLMADDALAVLLAKAVEAAARRSRELSAD